MRPFRDSHLTEHFKLSELTYTNNASFANENRIVDAAQIAKLTTLARLLEHLRFIVAQPLKIHSAYRCPGLNAAVGSTDASQHLKCEAADIVPAKVSVEHAFFRIRKDLEENRTNIGQLILETADRAYGPTAWIHVSLGTPFRDKAICRQVLNMENGVYLPIGANS